MAVKKKYKKLTNKEKQFRKQIKEKMVEEGLVKIKPRLNRKKFLEETKKEYYENITTISDTENVLEAIAWMTPPSGFRITTEAVGIIKIMKIAVEIKKFKEEKKNQGDSTYKISELMEVIKPIKEL